MTDNDIILGLKCIADEDEILCKDCAFRDMDRGFACKKNVSKAAIDLITRRKAEIERLNKEVDRLSQCVLYHDGIVSDLEKEVFNAKAEAIKEFAERLKKKRGTHGEIWDNDIENLVKEMTEETP